MQTFLTIAQIVISAGLVIAIILQPKGEEGSAIFGGGAKTSYYTKRGFEKLLFISTIVLAAMLIGGALLNLLVYKF